MQKKIDPGVWGLVAIAILIAAPGWISFVLAVLRAW